MQPMEMQQPMQMPPGQQPMATGGLGLENAIDKLASLPGIRVKQMRNVTEMVSLGCCEKKNKYIFQKLEDADSRVFFAQETTPCWARYICCPDCKPWSVDVYDLPPDAKEDFLPKDGTPPGKKFMSLDRPWTWTFLCFNRPEVVVVEEPSKRKLATLRDPFACCNLTYQMMDAEGQEQLVSNTSCLQLGFCCTCPGCEIIFPINEKATNSSVARIVKTWKCGDICPCCSKEMDDHAVEFGGVQSSSYKLSLMSMAIFLQLRLFDSRNDC